MDRTPLRKNAAWITLGLLLIVGTVSSAVAQQAKKAKPATGAGAAAKPPADPATRSAAEPRQGAASPAKNIRSAGATPAKGPPAGTDTGPDADEDSEDELDEGDDDSDLDEPVTPPKPGTPEWFVHEAARLRLERDGEGDDEEARKLARQRQQKILEYSQKAIGLTHKDREKDRLFQLAARHLVEARLKLAITGDEDQIALLYDDARAFYRRDPKSTAAADASHALVGLAYHFAEHHPEESTHWQKEFARQAANFARNYPSDRSRAIPLAYTAGRVCEPHGLTGEALSCFDLVVRLAPGTNYAAESEAVARRLRLPGNPPEIVGMTLADEPFAIDDLLGKPVLIVFWSSESRSFAEELPRVLPAIRKARKAGFTILGITLDSNRRSAVEFARREQLDWIHLYFSKPEEQGWNNPIAQFYGVFSLPAYWLVDASGNVVNTTVGVKDLGREVATLAESSGLAVEGDRGSGGVVPASGANGESRADGGAGERGGEKGKGREAGGKSVKRAGGPK